MRKFEFLWKFLTARRLAVDLDTPVISKKLSIMKLCKYFEDHLYWCVGVCMIPLSYVIHPDMA